MTLAGQGELKFTLEQSVSIPSGELAKLMMIRKADWQMLRHRLQVAADPMPRLSVAFSICFGIAITAAFSIIPIGLSPGVPSWVLPLYMATFAFSLAIGCILAFLDQKLKSRTGGLALDIIQDMDAIEKTLGQSV